MSEMKIKTLKRKAKQLAASLEIKYSLVLDLLAREEGYDNWKNLVKKK